MDAPFLNYLGLQSKVLLNYGIHNLLSPTLLLLLLLLLAGCADRVRAVAGSIHKPVSWISVRQQ